MRRVTAASLAIAALSTFGDFAWANWIPSHSQAVGVAHGAILFAAIGLALGIPAAHPVTGALGGIVIGAGGALTFYVLAPVAGYSAMFIAWFAIWIALAALSQRLHGGGRAWRAMATRGLAAAVGSGAAFYLVSGIWRPFDPEGWDYAVHFLSWTVAYLPGFSALMSRRS